MIDVKTSESISNNTAVFTTTIFSDSSDIKQVKLMIWSEEKGKKESTTFIATKKDKDIYETQVELPNDVVKGKYYVGTSIEINDWGFLDIDEMNFILTREDTEISTLNEVRK